MVALEVFKLYLLREDSDENSVRILEVLLHKIEPLNQAGLGFEFVALPRESLKLYQNELESGGVTSLPALVSARSGQCIAQGVPGINRWFENQLQEEVSPEDDYKTWVQDKVGTADQVAAEHASGRVDEDKFSGGMSDSQMSAAFDDFAREREKYALPDPRKAGRHLQSEEENPRDFTDRFESRPSNPSETSRNQRPPQRSSQPPQRSTASDDAQEISQAIASSGVDAKEAAMLEAMFGNMAS